MARLMVVDDSKIVYMNMVKLLQDTEFELVHYCRSGEEAIEVYKEVRPDLVTMDIIMPGMDGLEASRRILSEFPDARIIMLSSLAYDDTIEEAEKIGAKGFIYKPFEKEKVLCRLREVIKG